MQPERRHFLANIVVTLAGAKTVWAGNQRQPPWSQSPQFPDVSGSRRPRPDAPEAPAADPKVQLKESEKKLRRDVDHLLELANQLKDEADGTEQTEVLSLSLVKKAEEIEKLAKQIKDLVRTA
jgi:hypothetical protein